MINSTCAPDNHTAECGAVSPVSSVGLIVGLVVFFLLMVVAMVGTVAAVYVRRSGRVMWQPARSERRGPGKAEDGGPPPLSRSASHQYTTMGRAPGDGGHNAIYENYSGPPGQTRTPAEDGHAYLRSPEDDLYLQCDTADEAIYGNDPACSLAMLPDPHTEDDLYIMPDV